MDFLTQTILPYILIYKFWALFAVTFLSSLAIPMPASAMIIASAAFASQGYFSFWGVLAIVTIANIIGDTICFWIARLYGRKIFDYFSFTRKIIESRNFKLIEAKIAQRPGFVIFISRFESFATISVNAICGMNGMSYRKYLAYESAGALLDAIVYGVLGYIFGDSWEAINSLIGNFSIIVLIILVGIVILFWKKIMKKLSAEHLLIN